MVTHENSRNEGLKFNKKEKQKIEQNVRIEMKRRKRIKSKKVKKPGNKLKRENQSAKRETRTKT